MAHSSQKRLYVVDDDDLIRQTVEAMLDSRGYSVRSFSSGVEFLTARSALIPSPLLLDVRMPKIDGLTTLKQLRQYWTDTPVIMISGHADVPMAVEAMRFGASDIIQKPFSADSLISVLENAIERDRPLNADRVERDKSKALLGELTVRETEVLELLVLGDSNKLVANKLGISHRTVEVHRARIMQRLRVKTFAELVKLSLLGGPRRCGRIDSAFILRIHNGLCS